jgi:hypothetical protein
VTTSTPPVVTSTAQAAPPKVAVNGAEAEVDHDRYVGKFAVGYFGVSQLPIANSQPAGGALNVPSRGNVNAPVIGVRYWLTRMIGLDAGVGFGLTGGSNEVVNGGTSVSNDHQSGFGAAFHAGVPLALSHGKHFSFLVIPEGTIGFTNGTFKQPAPPGGVAPPQQDLSGFRLDLGGRIGGEFHFGFMGLPQLSLEATVGLFFQRESFKIKQDTNSASDGTTTLGTSVQSDPWAIFVNNISAFYYFE